MTRVRFPQASSSLIQKITKYAGSLFGSAEPLVCSGCFGFFLKAKIQQNTCVLVRIYARFVKWKECRLSLTGIVQ